MNPYTDLTYPSTLTPVPQWGIYDSTKINSWMECPRRHFYNYVLGWKLDGDSIHLRFGEAIHEALAHTYANLHREDQERVLLESYERFLACYRKYYEEDMDASNAPKSPEFAIAALIDYYLKHLPIDRHNCESLYTEVCGSVPISDERVIHFKLDALLRAQKDGIFVLEHKTLSQDTYGWADQWPISFQIGTYIHALLCLFPDEPVFGAIVNGLLFRKTKAPDVKRVPVQKSYEAQGLWLNDANYRMGEIEHNFIALSEAKESDSILHAFPRNTTACTKWGRTCPYMDFCLHWSNPLQRCAEPPNGIAVEHWDPSNQVEHPTVKVEDGKLVKIEQVVDAQAVS